ncbi:hypothetical protein WJ66_04198, partial [Stenotrophomonas maltophilia WJ66]
MKALGVSYPIDSATLITGSPDSRRGSASSTR